MTSSPSTTTTFRRKPKTRSTDDFVPEQYQYVLKESIPWKSIGFATFLFLVGGLCIVSGSLIQFRTLEEDDRIWPLIIIGCLMFIPGSYHVYIAFRALIGSPGYNFDDYAKFE
ncbi:transmembrane protein 230 [Lepeophtheirus salmonis]|uniref:transmembrane protein 230 n=1 Tax=Lepeophtheirus salmonis TaxID=72036 RepID=UPI00077F78B0|nr:transmembrane protein 230-like [Lepeophtheirus salmonis]